MGLPGHAKTLMIRLAVLTQYQSVTVRPAEL